MKFLKLIRFPNLLIVVFTQYAMRYFIIEPLLATQGFKLQLQHFHFLLLVLSTVFITAGGYVINDYFDRRTDMINKPDQVIVGKQIHRRWAMFLHILLNAIGVLMGAYVSYKVGKLMFSVLFLVVAGLLWFYSTTYKRQFLLGNLIVAMLTAMVPFLVVIFEMPLINKAYREILLESGHNLYFIIFWVAGFSYFAFVTTLIREIIKDVEDFEGDQAYGRDTLPIVLGINTTKIIIYTLLVIDVLSLFFIFFRFLKDYITLVYITFFLILPLLYLGYVIFVADKKEHYSRASNLTKIVMLFGILYSLVARFLILN